VLTVLLWLCAIPTLLFIGAIALTLLGAVLVIILTILVMIFAAGVDAAGWLVESVARAVKRALGIERAA